MRLNGRHTKLGLLRHGKACESQQQDTFCGGSLPKHEVTKILVGRYEQCFALACQRQHFFISDAGMGFSDVAHRVTSSTQGQHDGPVNALVSEDVHAASVVTI